MPRMEEVVDEQQVKAVESSDINFVEITGLPSRCMMYKNNPKIYGRPLKVIEVKKLATMTETNANAVVNDILKRSIKGINIDELLIVDKLYIVFWLRANTYREGSFSIEFKCDDCNEKGDFNFKIDNLDVNFLPDTWSNDKLTFSLPNNNTIKFHYLTVKEEQDATKFKSAFRNIIKDIDDEILGFALMIDEVNGEKLDIIDKYNYLISDDIDPINFSYIISYMKKYDCGVSNILKVNCEKCGGTGYVPVTFREEFFLPQYKISNDT